VLGLHRGLTGKAAEASLERAGITCNKNAVPFDPEKFTVTSGIRIGSPAATTRGFGVAEFRTVGALMAEASQQLASNENRVAPAWMATLRRFELADERWGLVEPLFPKQIRGRRWNDHRVTLNGMLWILCCGSP